MVRNENEGDTMNSDEDFLFFNNDAWDKLKEMKLLKREEIAKVKELFDKKDEDIFNTIRRITEGFVKHLYKEIDSKEKPSTEGDIPKKIQQLKSKEKISPRQAAQLHFLWGLGSVGSHKTEKPEDVVSDGDKVSFFYQFVEVVKWFVADKLHLITETTSPSKQVQDEFDGKELKWFWEVGNRPELIHAMDGVLDIKVGMFTDWWEMAGGAPYLILRGYDYVDREYVAELKYIQNFAQWPPEQHAGLLLIEMQEEGLPNPRNVYFWGLKTLGTEQSFAIEGLREQTPRSTRSKGMHLTQWLPADSKGHPDKLPAVIRVKQRQDGKKWKYSFEVAEDFGKPALFSYSPGNPHILPHYVGIFAKNFHLLTMNFHPQFKGFQFSNA